LQLLKALWAGWKRITHRIGVVQTSIIMTLFYTLVIGPASVVAFVLRRDLLRVRARENSYYRAHTAADETLDRYKHQF
jgi:hypothetical protein